MARKNLFLLFICFILLSSPSLEVYATTVYLDYDLKDKIDVSGGTVYGIDVDYSLTLPEKWREYVMVSQVKVTDSSKIVEKLSFYCTSVTKRYKPALLMTVTVYERSAWSEDFAYDIILKTPGYVFAVERGRASPFAYLVDAAVFDKCFRLIETSDGIKGLFSFPRGEGEINKNAIVISNKVLTKLNKKSGNLYYVPIRDVCEALGYTVKWNESEGAVIITKGDFYDKQTLLRDKTDKGYPYVFIDSRVYISSAYVYKALGKAVDIDNDGNIFIK